MSELHVRHIKSHLEQEFTGLINLSDISPKSKEIDNFFLTRALAAYAIKHHAQVSATLASDAVVDGGDDNGIDAIFYDSNAKVFYVVQSKWIHKGTGEPENGDVKKFISGIRDLFNFEFGRFNDKVRKKEYTIRNAVSDSKTKYQIILTYTGINDLAEHSRRDFSDLLTEFNDASEIVFLSVFNQRRIHSSLVVSADEQEPIDQQIQLKQFGKITEPLNGYYGQVNGLEIYSWWDKYRKRLFAKNIRGVLGETEVNSEITTTLDERPEHFWFFNNGITLICDSATKNMVGGASNEIGHFDCKNISIVNGAQTVSTIGKYGEENPSKLNNVFVPVRIIELQNAEDNFGQKITKANNTQNRVESRDFVTFDPEQTRIREELLIDGVDYRIGRGEFESENDISIDLVESSVALACASGDVSIVVQLKREISKLWENIDRAPYKKLFNPQTTGRYVYNCVRVQRIIETAIKKNEAKFTNGRDQSILIHGNRIISFFIFNGINKKEYPVKQYDFDQTRLIEIMEEKVYNLFFVLRDEIEIDYPNAIIPTLFKNRTKCESISTKVGLKLAGVA